MCRRIALLSAAAAIFAASSPAYSQGLIMVRDVSYDIALVMAQTALEHCRQDGFKVGVSVVDRGGHVLVTVRDHGAAHHTVELAQRKAYTSRIFRQTSKEFRSGCATIRFRQGSALQAVFWPRSAVFQSELVTKLSAA